jgi:pimeloyl-ACP methyl ester carboxylesterase
MLTQQTITLAGFDKLSIKADAYGDPSHQYVVFLHGGGQTRHSWGDACLCLAGQGMYAITMDLRGHGDSDWSQSASYSLQYFVEDLYRVLAQLPPSENGQLPILVGASLGGLTSLMAVGNATHNIASGLVLVDVVPELNQEGKEKILAFMRANPDGFASLEAAADAVAEYLPHRPRPNDISGLQKNLRLEKDGRFYWHWDPEVMLRDQDFHDKAFEAQLIHAARKIQIPTLLVRGMLSEVVDDKGVESFRETIPDSEVVNVGGAGHMVAGDRNNAFNQAVLAFIERLTCRS